MCRCLCDCTWGVEGYPDSFPSWALARKFANAKGGRVLRVTHSCPCGCPNCV